MAVLNSIAVVALAALLVCPISSFTTGVSSRPSSFLFTNKESANSWSEYKHDFVDPLIPHQVESKIHDHTDPEKRASSDEYWLRQMEQDKNKLNDMMTDEMVTAASEQDKADKPAESFEHYKQENIDPITPHEMPSPVTSHMDPVKREKADEFWQAKFNDEKEKIHSGASGKTPRKTSSTSLHLSHEYSEPTNEVSTIGENAPMEKIASPLEMSSSSYDSLMNTAEHAGSYLNTMESMSSDPTTETNEPSYAPSSVNAPPASTAASQMKTKTVSTKPWPKIMSTPLSERKSFLDPLGIKSKPAPPPKTEPPRAPDPSMIPMRVDNFQGKASQSIVAGPVGSSFGKSEAIVPLKVDNFISSDHRSHAERQADSYDEGMRVDEHHPRTGPRPPGVRPSFPWATN